ncbi:MAG: exonuclease SbcCD subunit D [Acidobacteriota bacterium]
MSSLRTLRFVHCADLHLDSPFEGLAALDPEIAEVLRASTFGAFDNILQLAIDEEADFLLIAGDVYDSAESSLAAQLQFRQGLERVASRGIRCFVAHGNHDPLSAWDAGLEPPPGVHRFGGDRIERVLVRRDGEDLAVVYGISYRQREVRENLVERFHSATGSPFSIGLLHCAVGGDGDSPYSPCRLSDLTSSRIGYWALGHSHRPAVLAQGSPTVVYSGTPQGRSRREIGERGCFLVDVEIDGEGNHSITPRFIATDQVRWADDRVDISSCGHLDDLLATLSQSLEETRRAARRPDDVPRPAILRLAVTGRGPLHRQLQHVDPERDLAAPLRRQEKTREDFVWVEAVVVDTAPEVDLPRLRTEESSVGAFLRAVDALRRADEGAPDADGTAARAIRERLAQRPEHPRLAAVLAELSDAELLAVLPEAEAAGLDYLLSPDSLTPE